MSGLLEAAAILNASAERDRKTARLIRHRNAQYTGPSFSEEQVLAALARAEEVLGAWEAPEEKV